MSFRPQFDYPDDPAWREEEFVYFFDRTNVLPLGIPLFPGQSIENMPLPLQMDVEFRIRAIEVFDPTGLAAFQLRDPRGNYLEDSKTLVQLVGTANLTAAPACELEIICPAGAVLLFDLANTLVP